MHLVLRLAIGLLSVASFLHADGPDISNLSNCINEVQSANSNVPTVLTFDSYTSNYAQLLADLQTATPNLPHVYQQAAAQPLISFLNNLGQDKYLQIFQGQTTDDQSALLQQIVPDAALAILTYDGTVSQAVNAFQEVVSDLYDGFLSDEQRVSQSGTPINTPTYGIIPPLVKFGNEDSGPYTWPADATSDALGMGCGVVSLPPSQINGGILAWTALGHETGGHDVTHADKGLLDELASQVQTAVLNAFGSQDLAAYWAKCIDETTADVCGYLNMGPCVGVGLIGYFRALGDGKLRTSGSTDDPHPIDLLRGYLGSNVVKYLGFSGASLWSQTIADETAKDNGPLSFVDQNGNSSDFPVDFNTAVAATDVVAKTILTTKLNTLQGHSLQDIVDWHDQDQAAVDQLVTIYKSGGNLPATLQGPGFYASYVVAAAAQAGLQQGTDLGQTFSTMQSYLAQMHLQNPTWSTAPTTESLAMLEQRWKGSGQSSGKKIAHHDVPDNKALVATR